MLQPFEEDGLIAHTTYSGQRYSAEIDSEEDVLLRLVPQMSMTQSELEEEGGANMICSPCCIASQGSTLNQSERFWSRADILDARSSQLICKRSCFDRKHSCNTIKAFQI